MVRTVRHVGIVVTDIESVLPFYRDLLGLKPIRQAREPTPFIDHVLGSSGCRLITIKMAAENGETLVELLEFQSPSGQHGEEPTLTAPGISHIALTVKDLDGMYRRLIQNGISFVSPPLRSPDGRVKVAFCRDPVGNYLELVEDLS